MRVAIGIGVLMIFSMLSSCEISFLSPHRNVRISYTPYKSVP